LKKKRRRRSEKMAVRKKLWSVEVPLIDMNVDISAVDLQQLDKKALKLDLTRILHGRSTEATFMISVKDGKATAEVKKLALPSFYIQRAIRKGISYVEDSFECSTEGYLLRIKPFLITRKRVHRSIRNALRVKAQELIKEYCSSKQSQEVFSSILYGKLQKELAMRLKKVYPLSFCEIRVLEVVKKS
jgi:ribosomal protein S3AE